MSFKIYPEVEIREVTVKDGDTEWKHISFATSLRRKHRGKWYFQDFLRKGQYEPDVYANVGKTEFLKDAYREVYFAMVFGVVDTKLQNMYGEKMYRPDPENWSEEERIKNQYPYMK